MQRGFLDRISSFSLILIMVVLMLIGAALIPSLRLSYDPSPKLGKQLTISCAWSGASAQVIEQEVISRIEGSIATVVGIESISSRSEKGRGSVNITLKEGVGVASTRFEIASLLKQVAEKLPEGVTPPELSGGDTNVGKMQDKHLLSYIVNSDMEPDQITEYIDNYLKPHLEQIEGVAYVWTAGAQPTYFDIVYNPELMEIYGLDTRAINRGISDFLGRTNIIGDVDRVSASGTNERITLLLKVEQGHDLGAAVIGEVEGRLIYLRDVAQVNSRVRRADRYFRVNGMNTINMNVYSKSDANIITTSDRVVERMQELDGGLREGVHITMNYDAAERIRAELHKLLSRTLLSLLILFAFVWLTSRSAKYVNTLALTLFANILISVILFYILDIELHIFSLAGIVVSFGIIIDTSIVMVDHYSYYRNRSVFIAILAALLTTIGSLIVIFFMPEYIKGDLIDFVVVIIINLSVSLLVSLLFVPAIIDRWGVAKVKEFKSSKRRVVRWNRLYEAYIRLVSRRKWISITLLILAFGVPLHLLPSKLGEPQGGYHAQRKEEQSKKWYIELYNNTIGSSFYQQTLKEPLEKSLGGSMRLFSQSLSSRTFSRFDREVMLTITAQLTESNDGEGNGALLNEKMREMDAFLATFDKIKRFETNVNGDSGRIVVEFSKDDQKGSFPFVLESEVISKALGIGGVDWSTLGVSERGFSNSLGLGRKSYSLELTGYNYEALRGYAEGVLESIQGNKRVADASIEDGRFYYQSNSEKGLAMNYDNELVAGYNIDLQHTHAIFSELLNRESLGQYRDGERSYDIDLRSSKRDEFDLWSLFNSYITVGDRQVRLSHIASIEERNANQVIDKRNQEYLISVAFNFLGSYTLADKFTKEIITDVNEELPIGYKIENRSWGWYQDTGVQYWLILLIVVIIFFISSILFESLRLPLVIISLIPISFIGTFLTYYFTGINFGTGGFASLVLLCGLVVNSAIYLINEYRSYGSWLGSRDLIRLYVKAYNHKITPIILTVISTVLGLVPFLLDSDGGSEFWLSFALGSISGLLFSLIALVLFMPILMRFKPKA